jgi:hypothetical protein
MEQAELAKNLRLAREEREAGKKKRRTTRRRRTLDFFLIVISWLPLALSHE